MIRTFATTNPNISQREMKNQNRSRKIAAEGMVLLENEGILPMELKGKNIALFGNGARHTVQGGTGSGEVNSRTVITVERGLERAGAKVATKAWLDAYDAIVEKEKRAYMDSVRAKFPDSPEMAFWAMFSYRNPLEFPKEAAYFASSDEDIAIYVLARSSGEGSDRLNVPGDYQMHQEEEEFLRALCQYYRHVVVVLNVGGVVDTAFLRSQPGIGALLLMGQAGSSGGDALADILCGKVSPGGRLAATWAEKYEDYPNADTFGRTNGNVDDEYYTEGIYVGYRWFDSFGKVPAYPFGYGKSYTTFSVAAEEPTVEENEVRLAVRVTNTGGKYAGREVVQVYVSAPEGELNKPYQELAAYAKTRTLLPGETQEMSISFPVSRMASYDERRAAWILERGDYMVRVGTHSRATRIVGILRLEKEFLCEQLKNVLPLDCEMENLRPERKNFYRYASEEAEKAIAPIFYMEEIEKAVAPVFYMEETGRAIASAFHMKETDKAETPDFRIGESDVKAASGEQSTAYRTERVNGDDFLTMDDVLSGKCEVEDLVSQLTIEEMAALCVGTARGGDEESSTIGAASAACPGGAGETTSEMLESRNIRNMILADGPAGLRLSPSFVVDGEQNILKQEPALGSGIMAMMMPGEDVELPENAVTHYQYCTAIPTATLLAQTWDVEAVYEAGDIVGSEMEEFGITLWLAPGMNIQRNPLCGRNFEYYSEDPLVSGLCATAETRGVQAHPGVGTTIKHFACNNLEDNRAYNNSHVTERALREIYLKGFEIAVKAAQPMAMMSAYNMINGVHAANSVELLTKVARDEWGFLGIVMSDWGTTAEPKPNLEGWFPAYGCSNAAACIKAGNDLIMPGSREDLDEIISAAKNPEAAKYPVTIQELRTCAGRILRILAKSNAYEGSAPYGAFPKFKS